MSPRNNQTTDANASARRFALNGPLVASLIALLVAGGVVVSALATVMTSALGMNGSESQVAKDLGSRVEANRERMKKYQEQIDGRSIFFKPPAWPAAPKKSEPVRQTPVQTPVVVKEEIPTVYTGPGILYAIGDMIRFKAKTGNDKPFDVLVGEEKHGVRVVSINLPWTVKVNYQGKDWDVPIFARGQDKFLVAQAKPMEVVPFFIEVPPKKPDIEVPKAGDSPAATVTQPAAAATRENPRAGNATRGDRTTRGTGRPEGTRPSTPRPAPRPEADEEDEADEEEAAADREVNDAEEEDEDIEEDEPSPTPSGQRGAPPAAEEDEEDEDEEPAPPSPRRGRPQPAPQGRQ